MRALLAVLVAAVLAAGIAAAFAMTLFPEEPAPVSCTAATGCTSPDLDIPRDHIDYYDYAPNE